MYIYFLKGFAFIVKYTKRCYYFSLHFVGIEICARAILKNEKLKTPSLLCIDMTTAILSFLKWFKYFK